MAKQTLRRRLHRQFKDIANWLDVKTAHNAFVGDSLATGVIGLSGRKLSVSTFYTVYRSSGDVFAVIRELAENTGMEGFVWESKVDPQGDANAKEVENAMQILNQNRTFRRWKADLIQDVMVSGNAYVHIEQGAGTGKPIALNFIDPRTMSAITDKHGSVLKWIQKVKSSTVEFKPDEIAQFIVQRDPNSPVFGLSPLEPIFWEVRTDQSAMISNYIFFENDAVPAAQYIMDDELTDEEQKRAVEALRKQIKGADKRHKSIAVKGVKDIKQLSVNAKDMEFHVMRMFTTEKICAAYGVPKSILNYTDSVNKATAEEQTKKFYQGTIRPLEELLAEFVNVQLLPKMGVTGIKLVFNPKTFENQQWNEASTRADQAQGIITINEARKLRGLEPYDANKEGEFVDKPVLLNGMGAVPLDDLGVDLGDVEPIDTEDQAEKEIAKIQEASQRYQYGRKTDEKNNG